MTQPLETRPEAALAARRLAWSSLALLALALLVWGVFAFVVPLEDLDPVDTTLGVLLLLSVVTGISGAVAAAPRRAWRELALALLAPALIGLGVAAFLVIWFSGPLEGF
jgi:uncharacterized membrane protein HdeD (DUF308 family)